METSKRPYAVALVFGTGELDLRVYSASNKEEALGLAFLDVNLQSKLNTPKTYVTDFKVMAAVEDNLQEAALEELRVGHKIGAIKVVRGVTGWGLKESKEYVDDLVYRHPEEFKDMYPQVYTR